MKLFKQKKHQLGMNEGCALLAIRNSVSIQRNINRTKSEFRMLNLMKKRSLKAIAYFEKRKKEDDFIFYTRNGYFPE